MIENRTVPTPSALFHPAGPFHVGEPIALGVDERDLATEYAAVQYLGIATRGQPIAVGFLALAYSEGPVWHHQAIGMAILPGRGVWVLIPVFDDWDDAREMAKDTWWMLRRVLGNRANKLGIQTAYVPVIAQAPRGRAPDAATVYDTHIYEDALGSLRPGDATPARVDATIALLLEEGDWMDEKSETQLDAIPRWLAELLRRAPHRGLARPS